MAIRIVPVTMTNKDTALELRVAETQKSFIETTAQCLEEAERFPQWRPVLLFSDDTPVGFAMYGCWEEEGLCGRVWLDRLLIDHWHQGRGYGKRALASLIDRLYGEYRREEIYLSVYETNEQAQALYTRFGFDFTGETEPTGEKVMRLTRNRWEKRKAALFL